jgi:hypothetical protein
MTEDFLEDESVEIKTKQKSIVEHLQAPRRKKKSYVTLALGSDIDDNLKSRIEYFVKLNFPTLTVIYIKSLKDLAKMYSRQIMLLIVSDGFASLDKKMEVIKRFKEKNLKTGMPVLFMTKDSGQLTNVYNEKLLAYQEVDDFIEWEGKSERNILNRISLSLGALKKRRSRRFPLSTASRVRYFDLRSNEHYEGVLLDISMHGGMLQKQKSAPLFKNGDQIKITLAIKDSIDKEHGESLVLSAKIRRAMIGGEKAGLSWEFLSEEKSEKLLSYITKVSSQILENHNWLSRVKASYKKIE